METNESGSKKEQRRLQVLQKYPLNEIIGDDTFNALASLASEVCNTPISLINIMDNEEMWSLASHGIERQRQDKRESACQFVVGNESFLQIENAREDDFFKNHELVINDPHLQFYAGMPIMADGAAIGSLCVYDTSPRSLEEWQIKVLRLLANEVISRLDLHIKTKELQDLNKQKDEIINIVSHDIRNPLSGIQGIAKLIQQSGVKDEAQLNKYMGLIEKSATQLLNYVNELMDLSYLESNSFTLNASTINLKKVLHDTIALHRGSADAKQIALKSSFSVSKETARFDSLHLQQILGNLLTNAIKFTPEGGTIQVDVSYPVAGKTATEANSLELRVQDTGIGIPEKYHDGLFTKFGDHVRPGTAGEKSTGLGLPILKRLVDAQNGSLHMQSAEGEGTIFTVTLAQIAAQEQENEPEPTGQAPKELLTKHEQE